MKLNFSSKAARLERRFFQNTRLGSWFDTGNGFVNQVVSFDHNRMTFRSKSSNETHDISRGKIRKAIEYVLINKTVTRREFQKFTNFNSALLGLLLFILKDIAKRVKSPKGLLRITLRGIRFFFSGLDRATNDDLELVVKNGGTFILCSYYYLRQNFDKVLSYIRKYDLKLLLDSGEFSAYKLRKKGKKVKITIQEYADFILKYREHIIGYFNLDVTNNPEKSKQNYVKLKKMTGISPIPVWHCNVEDWSKSDWDSLDQLVAEDHAIVAIGATVHMGLKAGPRYSNYVKNKLFEEIFRRHPNQNFHWLGGSSKIVFKYPFFSSDSSGYLKGREKNQVYYYDDTDISTKIVKSWTKQKCLTNNVRILSSLEDIIQGFMKIQQT